jgi:gamma-glutamyltranspeptidase/glutathione hydrolase
VILLRTRLVPALLASALLARAASSQTAPAGIDPGWALAGKAHVTDAKRAMVVSGHPMASEIGRDVLRRGGNAVDAAVAVGFALAVVHPEAGNIGGGGFMIFRRAAGDVRALDFRETAPAASTRDMYLGTDGKATEQSVVGHLASGVPGSVAGLWAAHQRFGRLSWRSLLGPAIRLAREGFVIDEYRHQSIVDDTARLHRFPASVRQFMPGGAPPAIGDTLRQPDLARTLEAIRDRGPAGFYRGWVADSIVAEMRRGGGIITDADLKAYRPVWRQPVRFTYRGYTLYSMPPVSSGGVTLGLILHVMEGFKPLPPFGSSRLLHIEAETMRRAYIERNRWLGDPVFVKNPVDRLLSRRFATLVRGRIDPHHATATSAAVAETSEGPSTTHYSIVDAAGNAVSITTTINALYGSAVTVSGAGFLLNDEMDDFAIAPGHANQWGAVQGSANTIAPGKRPLSSMTPTVVLDPVGKLFLVVGTPGGTTIITQIYHVISNLIDHRMTLAEAVEAPRAHHQALPDTLRLERDPSFLPAAVAELVGLGHAVKYVSYMGDVEAIRRTRTGWQGVSDPRRGGGGAGY